MLPSGVAATQARIAAIERRLTAPAPASAGAAGQDFESLLATAQAASVGSPAGPAAAALHVQGPATPATTAMGEAGAPPALAAYGNGRIPAAALAPIGQGQHRLWAPAATAFRQLSEAAARDGVTIRVTDSYRTYDAQVDLAARKGLYSQGGLAARPGTSNHGWGRSLDLDTAGGAAEWLRANGPRFGFHEDVPGEPWHWTYRPA